MKALVWLLAFLAPAPSAFAAPPAGIDPDSAIATWFRSLKSPLSGGSCCDLADCRPIDYRIGKDGYEFIEDGERRIIPQDRVLRHTANPVGKGVLCESQYGANPQYTVDAQGFVVIKGEGLRQIYCFVPAGDF